jgi:transcription elongation GreA/GreB family factor
MGNRKMGSEAAAFTSRLLDYCIDLAKEKVRAIESELSSSRESSASEGKSTAGDKHETARAMMHLEQEKLQRQLAEAQGLMAELERIDPKVRHDKVGLGALITTDKGNFFLATGLGKVAFEGESYFVVSVKAPIALQFLGRTNGDTVKMNGVAYEILCLE